MALKQLGLQKIQFNINDKIGQVTKLVGKEGDNKTRGLEIQLLYNSTVIDTTGIDCTLIAKGKGKTADNTFVVPATEKDISKGLYEVIYPSNLMKAGIVEGEIRFNQGDKILSSFIFEIDMARTLVVEEITDSIYDQRLIDVIVEAVANEDARIANEDERKSNEATRVSNESTRKSNETQRQSKEVARELSEDERKSNEADRVSNESARQSSESTRQENENVRQSNEGVRSSNEVDRVDFYEMLQQMLANGELNGEVTLAELGELAGEGRTDETVKGNADDIQDIMNRMVWFTDIEEW